MITFKIAGNKHVLPTDWSDVSYRDYVALLLLPNSLLHYLNLFTQIGIETLEKAQINNLEKIAIALSFLTIPPKFEPGHSKLVGPYILPEDVTLQSLGQFEDLRALLQKVPKEISTIEDNLVLSDLYLHACAIYVQKVKDGDYNVTKVEAVKEELKDYPCTQVIPTGGFFLFRPLTISQPTVTRSQIIRHRLKKLIQDFPGYQKTLELMHRSSESPEK